MQLTLVQLFGEGATQTINSIIIQKSSLIGLTPLTSNRAEQLLSAILYTALRNFSGVLEDDFYNLVVDQNGLSIDFDNSTLYDNLVIEKWKTLVVKEKIKDTFLINQFTIYEDI